MKSDADAFDQMHRAFGIGGNESWYRARMKGIGQIKAMRRKRNVSLAELSLAVEYGRRTRAPVTSVVDVFKLIPEAKRDLRNRDRFRVTDEDVARAIEHERTLPESVWLERLVRAVGPDRKEVYREWAEQQQ